MNCTTCGAAVQTSATFCHQCGAPVAPGGTAVAVGILEPPIRFTLEASALGLFGRSLLLGLSGVFLVPLPWTICWYTRWLAGEVRASDRQSFDFHGEAKNVWAIVTAYVLMIIISSILGVVREDDPDLAWLILPDILINLALLFVGWFFLRWAIDHLERGGKRWRFVGSVWGFLGWNILFYVSILTIIGWAWAAVGLYNWIADNVEDAGGKLRFLGAGHQMLWRTIVRVLWCATLLGMPWAIRWFYAWLIGQVELTPAEQA
ncbi:MAG: zinc ribbon domain-containing protein [Acidobacteria bacterium]|nr:zinc ribbon domain-containing protein [Acidobacteriota bacterium]MDA1234579.1 zinc ribbon domain-containing protein [Acidobacteriota bacterium]